MTQRTRQKSTWEIRCEKAELELAAIKAAQRPIMVDRDADLLREMRDYLDTIIITSDNIGYIRRSLFVPWDSMWNGWVRDETAQRENKGVGTESRS